MEMLRATVCMFAAVVISAIAPGGGHAGERDALKSLLKELDALRAEVRELRTEVRELRAEMRDLKKSAATTSKAPSKTAGKAPANKLQAAIVGHWKRDNGETYTFTDKGIYTHKIPGDFGSLIRGTYRFSDEDQIQLRPEAGLIPVVRVCRIEIDGDTLT